MGTNNLIYITITVIIFFIIIYSYYFSIYSTVESFVSCDFKHLILNEKQLAETKELFLKFTEIAQEYNIDFFAIGGTLIGSVRNGGLLPFDDDIDLGVLDNNIQHFENYKNDIYYFEKIFFGYKFKKNNSDMFIDIMIFEKKDNQYKIINNSWPDESFDLDEIYPLIKTKFSEYEMYIPSKHLKYLDRAFPNWDTKIKIDCGHHSAECVNEKYNIPKEFDINYEKSKYLCYSKF